MSCCGCFSRLGSSQLLLKLLPNARQLLHSPGVSSIRLFNACGQGGQVGFPSLPSRLALLNALAQSFGHDPPLLCRVCGLRALRLICCFVQSIGRLQQRDQGPLVSIGASLHPLQDEKRLSISRLLQVTPSLPSCRLQRSGGLCPTLTHDRLLLGHVPFSLLCQGHQLSLAGCEGAGCRVRRLLQCREALVSRLQHQQLLLH